MNTQLRIAGVIKESIVDGPGLRFVVFAQGCKHNCPGCHNPETHSFSGGNLVSIDTILEVVRKNPLIDGITLSGGEPFEQAEGFSLLANKAKKMKLNVMTYTGYTYEDIAANKENKPGWENLLANTDILVDGRFEIGRKSLLLKFRGSENQRMINVKESKLRNEVVVIE